MYYESSSMKFKKGDKSYGCDLSTDLSLQPSRNAKECFNDKNQEGGHRTWGGELTLKDALKGFQASAVSYL